MSFLIKRAFIKSVVLILAFAASVASILSPANSNAETIIVGIDDKLAFLEQGLTKVAPTSDQVCTLSFTQSNMQATPQCIELENSVFGPPVNLTLSPTEPLAVVANSVTWVRENDAWEAIPDTDLYLLDISGKPKVLDIAQVDLQPSGVAISQDGQWLAVAHRAAKTISILSISQSKLRLEDTIELDAQISAVAFLPDSQVIYATKFDTHHIAVVNVIQADDGKITLSQSEKDIPVGLWPYNLKADPMGHYVVSANTGNAGLPDGHADSLSVIDTKTTTVVNTVHVGDGPEGIAINHDGSLIAVPLLQGSAPPFKNTSFYHEHGALVVFAVDGFALTEIARFDVGGFPEGVVFSRDGKHLFLGNLIDKNVEVFAIEGQTITQTGIKVELPGQVVSMGNSLP